VFKNAGEFNTVSECFCYACFQDYLKANTMQITSVTSKGQITIPKTMRQQLGIHKGSKIEASIVGDHIELHISDMPAEQNKTGFGMLKSKRTSVPVDFDPAILLNDDRT
jgi:AbrB family looped-hinge helix DNA binding protein